MDSLVLLNIYFLMLVTVYPKHSPRMRAFIVII